MCGGGNRLRAIGTFVLLWEPFDDAFDVSSYHG
jgi:hypothetical protein